MEAEGGALCARHPEQQAPFLCSRCGDYLCASCVSVGASMEGAIVCESCTRRQLAAGYRSAAGITRAVEILFIAVVALVALTIVSDLMQISLLGRIAVGDFTEEEANANDLRVGALAILYLAVTIGLMVAFAMWMNRTNHNARSLGARTVFGPHAWGWFFCPVLNLWKPYQAVRELWDVSSPETIRHPALGIWWALWIGGNILSRAGERFADSTSAEQLITATWVTIVANVVAAGAAIAGRAVVVAIHRAQEARAAELTAVVSPAPPS
jgi:hypothetical protein